MGKVLIRRGGRWTAVGSAGSDGARNNRRAAGGHKIMVCVISAPQDRRWSSGALAATGLPKGGCTATIRHTTPHTATPPSVPTHIK